MNHFKSSCDQEMVESVTRVVLGVWNPEEILNGSVCEVLTPMTYEGNKPVVNGLFDLRMGTTEKSFFCETCQQDYYSCPGHFGHISLVRPVYHMHFMKYMLKIAKCFCYACSECLVPLYDPVEWEKISRKQLKARFQYIVKEYTTSSFLKCCYYCKTLQPTKYVNPRNTSDASYGIAKVYGEFPKRGDGESNNMYIPCEQMLEFLKRIKDEDLDKIGVPSKSSRPDWMICTVFPVPPPQVRPSVRQENNQKSEDDLTHKLGDIIVKNNSLREELKKQTNLKSPQIIDDWIQVLQYHVSTFIDNEIPGLPRAIQRSGRPIKSVRQRLGAKGGRLRLNLMGKRGDYTARTVITGEPNIALDEIGIPLKVAMNLTFPEVVTEKNKVFLTELARNGTMRYPGAKIVVKKSMAKSGDTVYNSYSLRHAKEKTWWPLQKGDVVHRHLLDGDLVFFNRQPSLHKMSMMGHRVRVLEVGNTFRLNVSATTPYNADFDGDEMNVFETQCMEGVCELKFLTIVHNQIISPQRNQCVIGLVQDTLYACFEITHESVRISRENYMNLMMHIGETGSVLPPVLTGRSIFNMIIPGIDLYRNTKIGGVLALQAGANSKETLENHAMVIRNGRILQGVVDKASVGTSPGGIIQMLWNDYNPKSSSEFIYKCQKLCQQWLLNVGHSIGASDCLFLNENLEPQMEVYERVKHIIAQACEKVNETLNLAKAGYYKPKTSKKVQDEIEGEIMHTLNNARSEASKVGVREHIMNKNKGNRLLKMIMSGSKGDESNAAQITCVFGQADVSGCRAPMFFHNRSLPHFAKFDNSPAARGFAKHSFKEGLGPEEFYFLASSTRIGLIDKTVKTADTGYIQRRLIKSMEDLMVHFDGTVRAANNSILQFAYGDDYFNATHLENAHIKYHLWDKVAFRKHFLFDDHSNSEEYRQLCQQRHELVCQMENRTEFYTPIMIDRVLIEIVNAQETAADSESAPAENLLDPGYIFEKRRELDAFLVEYFKVSSVSDIPAPLFMFRSYYIFELASKKITSFFHKRATPSSHGQRIIDMLFKKIKDKFIISVCPSGEMVGIVCSQSIGEPTTQLTLNLFHHIGASGKSATTGVPRMKELLAASKKIKTPIMTLFLKPNPAMTMEIVQEYAAIFEHTRIGDLLSDIKIFFEVSPSLTQSVVSADNELIADCLSVYNELVADSLSVCNLLGQPIPMPYSWVIRMEFKYETYYGRGISNFNILDALDKCFESLKSAGGSSGVGAVNRLRIQDYRMLVLADPETSRSCDDTVLLVRIYLTFSREMEGEEGNMWQTIQKITEKFLYPQHVKGIEGISCVTVEEITTNVNTQAPGKEFVLTTSGSRLKDVLMMRDRRVIRGVHVSLDKSRIKSNDIDEMCEVFGIEVARNSLIEEFTLVLEGTGGVNMRHITILVDTMTSKGYLIPIDRHGVKKNDIGPLSRATFEETVDQLLKAATFGEADHMNGVSANIMMGQIAPCGTGTVNLLLDETKILNGGKRKKAFSSVASSEQADGVQVLETRATVGAEDFPTTKIGRRVRPAHRDPMDWMGEFVAKRVTFDQ